jgi:heptosyltransferase-3
MTVDLTSGDRSALLSLVSGARYRLAEDPGSAGFPGKRFLYTHLSRKNGAEHMVLQNLEVVRQFGISTGDLTVDFHIPDEALTVAERIFTENGILESDAVVHVHPTSRWLFKCWKDEFMAGVISWLLERDIRVIVTSSPSGKELARAKRILSLVHASRRPVDLCGTTTIKQLAALIAKARVFLGVDSAPMHIAAAVNTPVIALFGPTGAAQWGPWGDGHAIVTKGMRCIDCPPGICDERDLRKCMEAITEEEVISHLSRALGIKDICREERVT